MADKLKFEDLEASVLGKHKADEKFKAVGVIGLGVMGHGIAQTVAASGIEVIGVEKHAESLKAGIDGLSRAMDLEIKRWGMTQSEKRAILSRVRGTTDLAELRGCDIIIEAVDENLELKRQLIEAFYSGARRMRCSSRTPPPSR